MMEKYYPEKDNGTMGKIGWIGGLSFGAALLGFPIFWALFCLVVILAAYVYMFSYFFKGKK